MTLVMAVVVGRKKRDHWLRTGRYLLLHVGLYVLQILLFTAEPTHRANWLFGASRTEKLALFCRALHSGGQFISIAVSFEGT